MVIRARSTHRIPLSGNPRCHALWQDESMNRDLKGIAQSLHSSTFEHRLLAQAAGEVAGSSSKKQRRS